MVNRRNITGILFTIFGLALGVVTTTHALYYNPPKEMPITDKGIYFSVSAVSLPKKLYMPQIGLETDIEAVGITFNGNMSTPKKLLNAGWYKYGTRPGDIGSAVIDGHVDNGFNLSGIFKDLKKMQIGSDVFVETETGQKLHFKVIDVKNYYYKNVPMEDIVHKTGAAYLNLITCDGEWLPEAKTSDRRVVVYTKLVE